MNGLLGVQTSFVDFSLNVLSGTYDRTFDLTAPSTLNPASLPAGGGPVGFAINALFAVLIAIAVAERRRAEMAA
ncbi:MAG: hypothetical protein U0900_24625 [Myxococcota bacterium]